MMRRDTVTGRLIRVAGSVLLTGFGLAVMADEPCGELDECRALIEINATDGDVGFHVLLDAEGWTEARITDPDGKKIFEERDFNGLREQKLTENFFESAEPPCWWEEGDDDVDWDEDEVVTLAEFLTLFPAGFYEFRNKLEMGGQIAGSTLFTHVIPAAPIDVEFDGEVISWDYDVDAEDVLGQCEAPDGLVIAEVLAGFEVVMEPEDDAVSSFTYSIRVPPDASEVSVPAEYLAALPDDTPLKVEVGAIELRPNGSFGNQTFTEEDGFCNNPNQDLCEED